MSELSSEATHRLKDLIQRSSLEGIQFHEVSAKLKRLGPGAPMESSEEAEVDIRFQTRAGSTDFGVRAQVELTSESGTATSVVAAEYVVNEGSVPDTETLELFASEVALMTLFPYLRESISNSTARVFGEPFWLPILQRGQFTQSKD